MSEEIEGYKTRIRELEAVQERLIRKIKRTPKNIAEAFNTNTELQIRINTTLDLIDDDEIKYFVNEDGNYWVTSNDFLSFKKKLEKSLGEYVEL